MAEQMTILKQQEIEKNFIRDSEISWREKPSLNKWVNK